MWKLRRKGIFKCKGNIELHRLLGSLFSKELEVSKKLDIIEKEYNIPVNEEFREDVNVMCNLGEGIEEKAMEKAISGFVDILMELDTPKDIIVDKIMEKFSLTEAQIKKYMLTSSSFTSNSSTPRRTCRRDARRTSCDKTHMRIFAIRRRDDNA